MNKRILQRRIDNAVSEQQRMMEEYGYIIHAVIGEGAHTHGLTESYGHPELECTLPIDPNLLAGLIRDLGDRVKAGGTLRDGDLIDDLIKNFPAKIIKSKTGLRLILPDPNGQLEREKMQPEYAAQYDNAERKRRTTRRTSK